MSYYGRRSRLGRPSSPSRCPELSSGWYGKEDGVNKLAFRMPAEVTDGNAGKSGRDDGQAARPAGTIQGYVDSKTNKWVQPPLPKGVDPKKVIAVLGGQHLRPGLLRRHHSGARTWASQLAALRKGETIWVSGRHGVSASGVQLRATRSSSRRGQRRANAPDHAAQGQAGHDRPRTRAERFQKRGDSQPVQAVHDRHDRSYPARVAGYEDRLHGRGHPTNYARPKGGTPRSRPMKSAMASTRRHRRRSESTSRSGRATSSCPTCSRA